MVATYDGATMKIYLDGHLDIQQSHTGTITAATNPLYIGKSFTNEEFPGYIKEVKIFNRALTEEEIKIEYNTMFNNEVQIHESGVLYAKDLKQY